MHSDMRELNPSRVDSGRARDPQNLDITTAEMSLCDNSFQLSPAANLVPSYGLWFWTGAPCSPQRTWAENGFFECFCSMCKNGSRSPNQLSRCIGTKCR